MTKGYEITSDSAIYHILTYRADRISELLFDSGARNQRVEDLVNLAKKKGVSTTTFRGGSEKIRARIKPFEYLTLKDAVQAPANRALYLALDHLQDPQNLGAICRSADAFSATGIVIPKDRSALVTPGVYAASVGTIETVPVVLATNLAEALRSFKKSGFWVIGMGLGDEATPIDQLQDFEKQVLVVGNELNGLSSLVTRECDLLVKIPMTGKVQSLNVSVATAIFLYRHRNLNGLSRD